MMALRVRMRWKLAIKCCKALSKKFGVFSFLFLTQFLKKNGFKLKFGAKTIRHVGPHYSRHFSNL